MECREHCAACCIFLSISTPTPLHPNGKKAGERCLYLTDDLRCSIYTDPIRPKVCAGFKADPIMCGNSFQEARQIMMALEGLDVNNKACPGRNRLFG